MIYLLQVLFFWRRTRKAETAILLAFRSYFVRRTRHARPAARLPHRRVASFFPSHSVWELSNHCNHTRIVTLREYGYI